jgi:cell volume regulation protein A
MDHLNSYVLIIIFSSTIIISYFYNIYAKKSGIPSVLLLILTGMLINFGFFISELASPNLFSVLKILGVVGLALIVLEAALDLRLVKEKAGMIFKSLSVAVIGLFATSYIGALFTVPLAILSSAIILPSIDSLDDDRREFMIYESTFSDILGIVLFYSLLSFLGPDSKSEIYGEVFGNLIFTIVFSIIISYILIYFFQNIKGHDKLFLLISILLLLYAVGKLFHLSSLIIILIFGMILNNYKLFFAGSLSKLIDDAKVESVLSDFKVVTGESAFVIRTFFFIIFGWSVSLGSMFNLQTISIGIVLLVIIYVIRALCLFLFSGRHIFPQLFLAPRGLITILLFFAIPQELTEKHDFDGVLLFIILTSCLIMTWSLIKYKKEKESASLELEDEDIETSNTDDLLDQEIKEEDL